MKTIKLICFMLVCVQFNQAQQTIQTNYQATNPNYLLLLNEHKTIQQNQILNEQIVDLVNVYTTDSVYKRKAEVHRSLFFPIIRIFGVRWKTIKHTREKLVGTLNRAHIPGADSEKFTEYDVNYDLVPHLPQYKQLAYEAYQAQLNMFKSRKKKHKDQAPFVYPDSTIDINRYKIHCECTPNGPSRSTLNNEFYPTIRPASPSNHPNFGEPHPTMGLYGAYVLDCNHRCHPEIHPYEWIWWYDVNPQNEHKPENKSWFIGFIRDASNRFKHWSSSPRIGEASIPFIFPLNAENKQISIEHIEYDNFDANALQQLNTTENTFNFSRKEISFYADQQKITVKTNIAIQNQGIRFYLSDVNIDKKTGYITGNFNLAMAVTNIWTGKVSFLY